jgi:hypothetical protein
MKNLLFITALVVNASVYAIDGRYEETMKKNIMALYQANDVELTQTLINTFERIGQSEKTKWEPFYYSAYGYLMLSIRENDGVKKDGLLDFAESAIHKAGDIRENDSEIVALEGFITMIRITVNPSERGQRLSGTAMQQFGKALTLNSANPRAMALMAQMQFGTATFFGKTPTEACAQAAGALKLFENESPKDPLAPVWGKEMTAALLAKCH